MFLRFLVHQAGLLATAWDPDLALLRNVGRWFVAVGSIPLSMARLIAWGRAIAAPSDLPLPGDPAYAVVLLSYRRPRNIEWIARAYLACPFIQRVTISNNHPDIDLKRFLSSKVLTDPRLELIQQTQRTRQGVRFSLAAERADKFDFFISPDDDCFLSPRQIHRLFSELIADPTVPHGFRGEHRKRVGSLREYPFDPTVTGEMEVEHLTICYTFTAAHAHRCMELYEALGWHDPATVGNGEDMALSFSGDGRPRIHDLGPQLQCNSWEKAGVATWNTHQNFFEQRVMLHSQLRRMVQRGRSPVLAQGTSRQARIVRPKSKQEAFDPSRWQTGERRE